MNFKEKLIKLNLENINADKFDDNLYDINKDQYFIIKSYSYDDILSSIKYKIWCSTENGNIRLNSAYRKSLELNGKILLLFSVNGSGCFSGIAQMTSEIDFDWKPNILNNNNNKLEIWSSKYNYNNKWKGKFNVKWLYIKNVPNRQLNYIKLENNENKPSKLIYLFKFKYIFKITKRIKFIF
jgi:YTH domain-containing family protein